MRPTSQIEEYCPDYFEWLCELVCVDGRYTDESYWTLAKELYDTEFYWSLDMDADRAADGVALRYRYLNDGGNDRYEGECNVLEMLVALADRLDTIIDELDGEDRTPILFWNMIDNLGLSNFSDHMFDDYPERVHTFHRRIIRKLEKWLDRDITYNGEGGLFPLQRPRSDQRNVDIWYQANAYLLEEYL